MSEVQKHAAVFLEGLLEAMRLVVREEIQAAMEEGRTKGSSLLTAGELANHLKVPVSWVYEQSRQQKIPTRRLGHYVRFSLREVLEHQKA